MELLSLKTNADFRVRNNADLKPEKQYWLQVNHIQRNTFKYTETHIFENLSPMEQWVDSLRPSDAYMRR